MVKLQETTNSKFEARNPKQARRTKIQMIKTKTFRILKLGHLNLFRASNFGFRISNQKYLNYWLVFGLPGPV